MVRFARTAPFIAALAASIAVAPAATGQGAPTTEREKVRLLYEAPESCADREQFLPQVRARLDSDWEALPGELARTIHVKISLVGDRYVARIELQDARGKNLARAVAGTRCEQVVEGIALVTALAIQAQLDEVLSRSEPVSDDSPAPKPPETPLSPAQPKPAEPARAIDAAREPAATSNSELRFRIGGRGLVQGGVGPELAWGFGAFAALVWPYLVLGVAVDSVGTGPVEPQGVPARFELLAARLDGCGRFGLLPEGLLTVEPCVFFQGGSLAAQGEASLPEVVRGGRGSTKWLAPGVLLALRSELGPVLLGLEGSAAFPLDLEQFYVDTGAEPLVVYKVPWLAASAALSAGVTF